jgi:zinc protease
MGGQLAERRELAGCGVLWMNSIARGAGGLSRGALGRALSNLAASISASGGRSSQALRLDAPAQSLTSALEFLLCVLSTPHFDEAEVDLAREGVLDQLASRDDDAESRLASAMAEVAFPSHPWGLDFLGTVESLTAVRPDVLRSAHRSWARPENLVVSVVGDVDVEATVGRLRHALSTLPAGGEPAAFSRVVHPRGTRRVKLTSARDQAHVSMLFPGLSVRDPRGGALDLLIEVLSSQSGRLFTELREQRGLAYQVGAASVDGPFGGVISAGLSTHPARAVEAEQSLATSLATIAAGNIDDAEVERARAALLGGAEANLQSVGSRASQLAYSERYGLDGRKYRDIARRSANVGADEVRAVAATLLRRATVVGRIGGQE